MSQSSEPHEIPGLWLFRRWNCSSYFSILRSHHSLEAPSLISCNTNEDYEGIFPIIDSVYLDLVARLSPGYEFPIFIKLTYVFLYVLIKRGIIQ